MKLRNRQLRSQTSSRQVSNTGTSDYASFDYPSVRFINTIASSLLPISKDRKKVVSDTGFSHLMQPGAPSSPPSPPPIPGDQTSLSSDADRVTQPMQPEAPPSPPHQTNLSSDTGRVHFASCDRTLKHYAVLFNGYLTRTSTYNDCLQSL